MRVNRKEVKKAMKDPTIVAWCKYYVYGLGEAYPVSSGCPHGYLFGYPDAFKCPEKESVCYKIFKTYYQEDKLDKNGFNATCPCCIDKDKAYSVIKEIADSAINY